MEPGKAIVIAGIIIATGIIVGHSISKPIPDLKSCAEVFGTVRIAMRRTHMTKESVQYVKFPEDCSYWMNAEFLVP